VGFCLAASEGISSRVTLHVARIGVPSGRNRVYLAFTDLR
jgi:hypothetical protein